MFSANPSIFVSLVSLLSSDGIPLRADKLGNKDMI